MQKTREEQMEECTHNCNTCMANCDGGEGKLDKALNEISSWKEEDLLKELEAIANEVQ